MCRLSTCSSPHEGGSGRLPPRPWWLDASAFPQRLETVQVFAVAPAEEALAFAGVVVLVLEEDVIDFAALGRAVIDDFQLRQLERFAEVAGVRPDEVIGFLARDVQGEEGGFIDG